MNHLSFSPDGRYIASASFDKKVKIWDGRTGRFMSTLVGHVGAVYMVAWAPDSRFLVSASKDSTLKLWEVRQGHGFAQGDCGGLREPFCLTNVLRVTGEQGQEGQGDAAGALRRGVRSRLVAGWGHGGLGQQG